MADPYGLAALPGKRGLAALPRGGDQPVDVDLFQDWVSRAAKQAWQALKAPGDIYASQEPVTSAEMVGPAADLAGMVMGGTGATAPAGSLGAGFVLDYFGKPVKILQNPSPKETMGFLNRTKYKAARRITDPESGEVFIWDAADPALHQMVAEKLGVKYDPKQADMIGLD